ncbi:hypothetical protein ABLE93_26295, partial [Xanthobacter sp. KR7-65]|uniref:hypothetical protein n=1 Tax=Xanthobacter sp. KR7-65 TaxID=3156612 RepID=UPI0032B44C14
DGICRCAKPEAPRQTPPLTPPNRPNPTARANSPLDKSWGQRQAQRRIVRLPLEPIAKHPAPQMHWRRHASNRSLL